MNAISTETANSTGSMTLMEMTSQIVSAFCAKNSIPSSEISTLIVEVHKTLQTIAVGTTTSKDERPEPAVPVKKSITPDYLICLEDGRKLKMLKRYLRTTYNMTPEEYRARWNLPNDYPMVAPNYSEHRSSFAKKIGLGRKSSKA